VCCTTILADPTPVLKRLKSFVPVDAFVYLVRAGCFALLLALVLSPLACKRNPMRSGEFGYVAVPQATLRDRVAALYNRVGAVRNGEKVEILERQKRFVKVRTSAGLEGWLEQRYLINQQTFSAFEKLAAENASAPSQGKGTVRAELNMHITPARDSEKLYQLAENSKVDILRRATAERILPGGAAKPGVVGDRSKRPQPPAKSAASKPGESKPPESKPQAEMVNAKAPSAGAASTSAEPKLMDDWWLVRDPQGHVGWVLARMIDIEVPMEVAQYAEGQRIQACFALNSVRDGDKDVSQYLVLLSPPKDGFAFDFDAFRIFTWNLRRHRYETAYRERNIMGFLPVTTATRSFDREGTLPIFTVRLQTQDGSLSDRTYRLSGPIVKRVLTPGEEVQKLAQVHKKEPKKQKHKKK